MQISISNIAWDEEDDAQMYSYLEKLGFDGIEIAPTRIWKENPYDHLKEAQEYRQMLWEKYHLKISSMQSIWFGRTERIFGTQEERKELIEYTKKALEFANMLGCENLVFGCPRNRNVFEGCDVDIDVVASDFFGQLAECAEKNHTVLAMEANPPIYNTNYMNTTIQAYELVKQINHRGFKLNYDLGTVIHNQESLTDIACFAKEINHAHISEPGLKPINIGEMQKALCIQLNEKGYERFVSLEMGNPKDILKVQETCCAFRDMIRGL